MGFRSVVMTGIAVIATSLAAVAATAAPAHAEYDIKLESGDHDTLRAKFFEHANGAGSAITYYGGSACTAGTKDIEYRKSSMPSKNGNSWNDSVSSWNDFNGCDIRFFSDVDFEGLSVGWLNAGTGSARNMPSGWNDIVSSFQVS